jgi:NAD+ synthase (glutamine-hydrolysing)
MTFRSIYARGFARVAAAVPRCHLADPQRNAEAVLALARRCHDRAVAIAVYPELFLSGYSIEDLLMQDVLLDAVEEAVAELVRGSATLTTVLVVGAPLRFGARIYNSAIVIHRGRLLGVVPKTYLPTYREFYEARHFASGEGIRGETIRIGTLEAPFGTDLLFPAEDVPGLTLGVEICEDMWIPVTPGSQAALAGATVLANLSGSPITIGRASSRNLFCQSTSARCLCAYVYAAGGAGESTTDLSWDGQTSIFENGLLLREGERFATEDQLTIADVDLDLLRQERNLMGTFEDNRRAAGAAVAYRSCRTTPCASRRIATRATTSRSPAWRSACRRSARSVS